MQEELGRKKECAEMEYGCMPEQHDGEEDVVDVNDEDEDNERSRFDVESVGTAIKDKVSNVGGSVDVSAGFATGLLQKSNLLFKPPTQVCIPNPFFPCSSFLPKYPYKLK